MDSRRLERLALACAACAALFVVAAGYQLATTGDRFWVAIMLGNALVFGLLLGVYRVRRRWRRSSENLRAAVVYHIGGNGDRRPPR